MCDIEKMRDPYDPDEWEWAETDAFLEQLKEKQEEYFSTPRVQAINMGRIKEFKMALNTIARIVKSEDEEAVITFTLDDDWHIGYGSIEIDTKSFVVRNSDILSFASAIQFVSDFEVYPIIDDRVRISIGFHGVMDELKPSEGANEKST
jgi:hypothetical protein